ncbi:MAG: ferrous iron transport protein A [Alkalinema sp. CACIAM 70d]|uniref:FeoA family protein n=1 Tax=Alkalinema sp. FACHB-956 TaxID=2692768 RepID=UPI000B73D7CF|nr:FeoA family protein [Alkalinema sp. FACHB-956]MBD2328671.1 ferrous iron transport protein A [Alkalinema sp. FACHB-956]OUC14133.1 MAG: ferrous iron transport protein A [Alkalinema sp. CACIAM 70d]
MPTTSLANLKPGQSAEIVDFEVDPSLERRLHALGFRQGQEIHLLRRGWLSGPLHVRICMTELMLRHRDAHLVRVTAVNG